MSDTIEEIFQLVRQTAKLTNLNVRTQKKGPDDVPAVDIDFEVTTSNQILNKLDSRLLPFLYDFGDQVDIEDEFRRQLAIPLVDYLPYGLEMTRQELCVHDSEFPDDDVTLNDGKTKKFKITPVDGGSVKVSFQCQFGEPDPDSVAALMRVMKQAVPISLRTVAPEEEPDNFQQADLLGQEAPSVARAEAEKAFTNPAGAQSPEELVGLETSEAPEVE